jgi:hypothetical protein
LALMAPVFAAFALVLLAACANASNVMLARAKLATTAKSGYGSRSAPAVDGVVRQLLTEGFLSSPALAGATGLGIAAIALRAGLTLFVQRAFPRAVSFAGCGSVPLDFDRRVFLFSFFAVSATTLLFALLPALHATRLTLLDAIRGHAGSKIRSAALRSILVGRARWRSRWRS